jgi:hypothetical protein
MTVATVTNKQLSYPWDKSNAAALKTLLDALVTAANLGTLAGDALSADETGRAAMENDYFDAATVAAKFDTGSFPASAAGRAIFANDFFDAATIAAVVDAKAIDTGSIADSAIEALQIAADAVTTAKILDANVTAAKLEAALCAAPSARSGPGAIAITSPYCELTTTGTGDALTLADGAFSGQQVTICHIVDGGTGVITQTTGAKLRADIATITFTDVDDWVRLVWTGTLWTPMGHYGVTIAKT